MSTGFVCCGAGFATVTTFVGTGALTVRSTHVVPSP